MTIQPVTDKLAIGISAFCALHCLAMPLIVVLMPALSGSFFADEHFHLALIFLIVPSSIIALSIGCKKHSRYNVWAWGGSGMAMLVGAVVFGHDYLGELGEQLMTLAGATVIAYGHLQNYRLCRQSDCGCSES